MPSTAARAIPLVLRTRDRTTGTAVTRLEELSVARLMVVVVDLWTRHPCSGATAHAATMIPAWNRVLGAARALGIPVVFASSGDDLTRWEGTPRRTGVTSLPHQPMPASNGFLAGHGQHGPWASPCMCPVTRLDAASGEPRFDCRRQEHDPVQHPDIAVEPRDLFIAAGRYVPPDLPSAIASWGQPAQQELWNLCRARGTTHLLYVGNATNMCVINREFGMIQMRRLGLQSLLVRDLTSAMTFVGYDPDARRLDVTITPAEGTTRAVEYVETHVGPSLESAQLIAAAAESPSRLVYARAADQISRQEGAR